MTSAPGGSASTSAEAASCCSCCSDSGASAAMLCSAPTRKVSSAMASAALKASRCSAKHCTGAPGAAVMWAARTSSRSSARSPKLPPAPMRASSRPPSLTTASPARTM